MKQKKYWKHLCIFWIELHLKDFPPTLPMSLLEADWFLVVQKYYRNVYITLIAKNKKKMGWRKGFLNSIKIHDPPYHYIREYMWPYAYHQIWLAHAILIKASTKCAINTWEVNFLQPGLNFDESLLGQPYPLKHTNASYERNDMEKFLVIESSLNRHINPCSYEREEKNCRTCLTLNFVREVFKMLWSYLI